MAVKDSFLKACLEEGDVLDKGTAFAIVWADGHGKELFHSPGFYSIT